MNLDRLGLNERHRGVTASDGKESNLKEAQKQLKEQIHDMFSFFVS
jgi:hypothetical protein